MNSTEKKQKEALMKNNLAMSYLAFALTTEEGLDFLEESKSAAFSGGEAHRVYKVLKDEYVPMQTVSDRSLGTSRGLKVAMQLQRN